MSGPPPEHVRCSAAGGQDPAPEPAAGLPCAASPVSMPRPSTSTPPTNSAPRQDPIPEQAAATNSAVGARSNPGAGRRRRRLRRRGKIQSRSLLPRAAAFNSRLPHRCCRSSSCSTAAASRKDEVEHTSMNLWRHRRFSSRQNDLAAWDRPESSSVEDDEYFARANARLDTALALYVHILLDIYNSTIIYTKSATAYYIFQLPAYAVLK